MRILDSVLSLLTDSLFVAKNFLHGSLTRLSNAPFSLRSFQPYYGPQPMYGVEPTPTDFPWYLLACLCIPIALVFVAILGVVFFIIRSNQNKKSEPKPGPQKPEPASEPQKRD